MEQRYTLKKNHKEKQTNINILMYGSVFCFIFTGLVMRIMYGDESWAAIIFMIIGFIGLVTSIIMRITSVDHMTVDILNESKEKLETMGINHRTMLINTNVTKGIDFNEDSQSLIYVSRVDEYSDFNKTTIPFDKILDVTINSDNVNKISVSKGGLIGGSLIGGALMGGFGSVVGAMGANKTSEELIHNLDLVITLDDLSNPIIKFNIINNPKGLSTQSLDYRKTIDLLDEWFGKFTIILKRNENK